MVPKDASAKERKDMTQMYGLQAVPVCKCYYICRSETFAAQNTLYSYVGIENHLMVIVSSYFCCRSYVLSAIDTPGPSGAVCQLDAWTYHAGCARIAERVATVLCLHNSSNAQFICLKAAVDRRS